jgi:nicotinic acid phosphoribosyltransferase
MYMDDGIVELIDEKMLEQLEKDLLITTDCNLNWNKTRQIGEKGKWKEFTFLGVRITSDGELFIKNNKGEEK